MYKISYDSDDVNRNIEIFDRFLIGDRTAFYFEYILMTLTSSPGETACPAGISI